MPQYATALELASYLQQDVDTSTANLLLTLASAEFDNEADTTFVPTNVTHIEVGHGSRIIQPPFKPVNTVTAIRIDGVVFTDFTVIKSRIGYWRICRASGFGWWVGLSSWNGFPPQSIEVDLNYGYSAATDLVKAAVLETAGQAYMSPVGNVIGETIDDYRVQYGKRTGGVQLTPYAKSIAATFAGYTLLA